MTRKSPIIPHYDRDMDFEIFNWQEMHNQAEQRYWRDLDNQRLDLDDRLSRSEISRNVAETELIRKQLAILERQEEEAKRVAYERWIRSPEGQAYVKKYNDRQYFVRVKSINFLIKRPYNLLARKNLESITYKNYISVIFWIFMLYSAFSFNPTKGFSLIGGIILPIITAIFMAVIITLIFYFASFEIKYFFQN